MELLNTIAIIQARMTSKRLPGKVLLSLGNDLVIDHVFSRVKSAKKINKVVIAITTNFEDDILFKHCLKNNYDVYRGSEEDVLERYFKCALKYEADRVVRITADCPLIDPILIDEIADFHSNGQYDYVSNTIAPSYPDGLDTEIFTFSSLKEAHEKASSQFEREHVTPYIKSNTNIKTVNYKNHLDYSNLRWTLDEPRDYEFLSSLFGISNKLSHNWCDILELAENNKVLINFSNQLIKRNEGATMGNGQKLYKRAKESIPGGNMLLSKRPEMFLPEAWPSYFDSASGIEVKDLDGNTLIDMCIMGIGTNSLGYGDIDVDKAVSQTISKGNMSTLNCPEEVYLIEKLISMHPWAGMGKLTRSGGEANSVALRIARASSGKSKVAICGYHGWHDWYLSANLSSKDGLKEHLLPGLSTKGVPRSLEGDTIPFFYNNIKSLEKIFTENDDVGVIFMEVQRNDKPQDRFLEKVRELATKNEAVLIFDECTSGFRECFGGLHLKYNVEPDLAMFGKALGNGYAINAVIGRKEIMQAAQDTFISSTFWTERVGPSAALACLEKMNKTKSWEIITELGGEVKKVWRKLSAEHKVEIEISGLDSLASFIFASKNHLVYKTFLTQEMLKKGYLASTIFYASTSHSKEIISEYGEALKSIFHKISNVETGKEDIKDLLKSPVCHSGFSRLN